MTTRPLTPRIPAPERPWRPRPLLPRLALLSLPAAILVAGAAGLLTSPTVLDQEPTAAAHYSVRIANFAFSPAAVTVNSGDTITWTNEDTAPHTVTTSSGPQALNSPTLSQNQSWSYTFSAAGVYSYYCAVHPDMRAEVVVKAPAATVNTTRPQTHPATTRSSHAEAVAPAPSGAAHVATVPPSASLSPSSMAPSPTDSSSGQAAVVNGSSVSGIGGLSPALLLGGLTAAIAVFCLLLVASRAVAREGED
jgi:amicyanin